MAFRVRSHYTYTCDGCGKQAEGFDSAEPDGWRTVTEPSRLGGKPDYRHFCTLECAERYGARTFRALWNQAQERAA